MSMVRAARQQDLIGEVRNRLTINEILKRNKAAARGHHLRRG